MPSSELARQEGKVPVNLGGPITDLDQAMRAADILSRSDLLPKALRGNAPNTLLVMLTGQELGLTLTQAFRTIYVPSGGQPQLRGVLVLAKLRQAGHTYRFEETEDSCTFTVVRGDTGEEYEGSFTVEDAITAKLARRNADGDVVALSESNKEMPWMLYRHDMLQWRAVARGALRGAPEVMLGFEVAGAVPPEPAEEVQLKPEAPAPPPAEEAAHGDAAGQAAQLRELDERMRGEGDAGQAVTTGDGVTVPPPAGDPFEVEPEPVEDAGTPDTGSPSAPPAEPGAGTPAEPADAPGKAKAKVLSEWFTTLGYDPAIYRPQVLHACSAYVQRPITNAGLLRAAEIMQLTNELAAIYRRKDELAPVSRLADEVDKWVEAWRTEDPAGYAAYEESRLP